MNTKQNKRSKRWLWLLGIVLLAAILVAAGARWVRQNVGEQEAATGEIVTAVIGDLSASATASGQVQARRSARLSLTISGQVDTVVVTAGDEVQAGDVLLRLATTELERAVANTQQNLIIQEANLATLQAPASAAEVAAAEAAVMSAQASLDDLLDGPSADEIAAAEASLRAANADVAAASARLNAQTAGASQEEIAAAQIQLELAQQEATRAAEQHSTILVTEPNQFLTEERLAELEFAARTQAVQANAALAQAQETLANLQNGNPNAVAAAQAGLAAAVAQRDAAQARLDQLLNGISAAQMASAKASLAQAQANLDKLRRGPSAAQIAAAEVQVEQARLSWQQARHNLAQATLIAPFDGVVTAVYVHSGEAATGVLIEMAENNSLEVVLAVDEIDVGTLAVGQSATITLEAWPDQPIAAEVVAIAPEATPNNSAVATYAVYLTLGQTDLPLRLGMTANASLLTAQRQGVLLVPNAAITADRTAGAYHVNRVQTDAAGNRTIEVVPVTIGLRDGANTQITSGLQAGDHLLVGNTLPVQRFGPGD